METEHSPGDPGLVRSSLVVSVTPGCRALSGSLLSLLQNRIDHLSSGPGMWGAVSEGSWGYWDTVIVDRIGYRGGHARQCTLGKGVYAHSWPRASVLQGQGWTSFDCPGKHFSPPHCLSIAHFLLGNAPASPGPSALHVLAPLGHSTGRRWVRRCQHPFPAHPGVGVLCAGVQEG